MPTDYEEGENKEYLVTSTDDIYLVSQYTRLAFNEVLDLDCYTFKKLLVDAFISKMKQTQEGQEWLEKCYILQQTSCDTDKLKTLFSKKG